MRLLNTPLLAVTTSITFGILFSHIFPIPFESSIVLFCFCIVCTCITFMYVKQRKIKPLLFVLIAAFTFFTFGNLISQLHQPKNYESHYTNLFTKDQYVTQKHGILFDIDHQVNSSTYYYKYIINLKAINTQTTQGKLLLRIPKNTHRATLKPGTILSTYAMIEKLPKALNPNQFDYSNYLNSKFIYHQLTLKQHTIKTHSREAFSLRGMAFEIRSRLVNSLRKHNFSDRDIAFMNALILGQKQELNKDTSTAFRNAGVMHVLTVSGLHVGIILLFLNFVLKPLERFTRYGYSIKTSAILFLLWGYALVSGLSPSVLRAVTMFTFIAIAIQSQRRSATLNALIASFLILLCYQPSYLFETGFQLSYVAVLGILLIHPKLQSLLTIKNIILKKIWELCSVTIAAQVGLFPLLLFNFHQFPLLFLASNLLVLPMITMLLFSGVVISILSLTNSLPALIREAYSYVLDINYTIVKTIASYDSLSIQHIHFSSTMLISSYAAILLLLISFSMDVKRRLGVFVIVLLIISGSLIVETEQFTGKQELVIFHKTKRSILGLLNENSLLIYTTNLKFGTENNTPFDSYLNANKASLDSIAILENVYSYNGLKLLRMDAKIMLEDKNYTPDILLLTNSPKIHLTKIIKELKPKIIIADGSNYKTDINRWESTCYKLKTPFHRTDRDGAFITKAHSQ